MTRRQFVSLTASSVLFYSFYNLLNQTSAWGKPIEPIIKKWIKEIEELAASVQSGTIRPQDWQVAIERLHSRISIEEVIRFTDLEKVLKTVVHSKEKLALVEDIKWPEVEGFPKNHNFGRKIFIYRKGDTVPPHAHNHLVSAHLIIQGNVRARTFDRIEDLEKSILIKPIHDSVEKPGSTVTMSDYHNNVHWFEGISNVSASFDIPVFNIEPEKSYKHQTEKYNQIHLDSNFTPSSGGLFEAKIIAISESIKKFS